MRILYVGDASEKAREAAEQARIDVRNGRDVAAERRAARAPHTDTIEALVKEYLEKHARKRKKSAAEDERVLNVDVLPHWKDRSVGEITRRDVRKLVERIADRGAPIMANRTLEIVRKMLNFGVSREWLDANPASMVEKPGIERARERVLTDDEIRRLWRLLGRFTTTEERPAPGRKSKRREAADPFCPLSPALAAVQQVRLITAQRGGEVVRMRWVDLDLDAGWWTIPAGETKNGKPHRVPLTARVIAIIRDQDAIAGERGAFVFTGRGGASVDDRVKKAGAELSRVLGFEFQSHDLRRTAATRMAAAGVPHEHVARVLNHVERGPVATRVYDRYDYDREKRSALEAWDRALAGILQGKTGRAPVVSIRRA